MAGSYSEYLYNVNISATVSPILVKRISMVPVGSRAYVLDVVNLI